MAPQPDVMVVVPARGGSKSIPRKNLVDVGGRPLLAWTIDAARHATHVTRVIVSTEDDAIAKVARGWGAAVRDRPPALAEDHVSSHPVVVDAVEWAGAPDILVLAHPTAPFRTAADFDACIQMVLDGAMSAVGIYRPAKHPYHMVTRNAVGHLRPFAPEEYRDLPRQDFPDIWALNGAVYAAAYEWWVAHDGFWGPETVGYEMPPERSVDIDEPWDLQVARSMVDDIRKAAA